MPVRFAAALLLLVTLSAFACQQADMRQETVQAENIGPKPNILLIMLDDAMVGDIRSMPNTNALLKNEGLNFENSFVTDSVCCPSRATSLRGQYAHNTYVTTNYSPSNGEGFRARGMDNSTVATWLDDAGYRTGFFGVYLKPGWPSPAPPGWDRYYGWTQNGLEFDDSNIGGPTTIPAGEYPDDYTAAKVESFMRDSSGPGGPFFAYWAPFAPHEPATPPDRYKDMFSDNKAPRVPSFNEADVSDKPSWNASKPKLNDSQVAAIDELYRDRLRTLRAVDDSIGKFVTALQEKGELDNTYIVLTSDNGMHMGIHRLTPMKQSAYEEDIRVPLLIRGPGVPKGETRTGMALNNDLAPTFADWGGAVTPDYVDGRSLRPLIAGSPDTWRSYFLVEKFGTQLMDETYKGVRTPERTYVRYSNGERELYNLTTDPYQLDNAYPESGQGVRDILNARVDALRLCKAQECVKAENGELPATATAKKKKKRR